MTITTDANSVFRDGPIGSPWYPRKNEIRPLFAKIDQQIVTRLDSLTALQDATWAGDVRPGRVVLSTISGFGDGGAYYTFDAASTLPEDGVFVVKDAAVGMGAGRWILNRAAPHGPKLIEFDDLKSFGRTSDTGAMEFGIQKMLDGFTIVGQNNCALEAGNLVFDADKNPLWEDPANTPLIGGLRMPGIIYASGVGTLIEVIGNRGGAKGHLIHLGGIQGVAVGEDEEYETDGISFINSGFSVSLDWAADLRYILNLGGCWSGDITAGQLSACHTGLRAREGSNESTSNGINIRINHIGGPFNDNGAMDRRLRSPKYGVDLDSFNGGHVWIGAAEYCTRTDENCAVRFGPKTKNIAAHFYLEGVLPLTVTSNLLQDQGENNHYTVASSDTPNVALGGIELSGINGEMRGVGSRTGPAPRSVLTAEDGAGPIDIHPGNRWLGGKTAHIANPNLTDPYNLDMAGFSGIVDGEEEWFWAPGNCTVESVPGGDIRLPPAADLQAGVIITTANSSGSRLISPSLTFEPVEYERVAYKRFYAKLMEGSASCGLACFFAKEVIVGGEIVGFEALTDDDGFSQGTRISDRIYRIDIADKIPANTENPRVCLAQRRSQMVTRTVTAATKSNPLTVTVPGHNYTVGQKVAFSGILGMTQLNEGLREISGIVGNVLTFAGVNSTGWGTFVRGITAATNTNPLTVTIPGNTYVVGNVINFEGVDGMTELNGTSQTVTAKAGDVLTFGATDATEWGVFIPNEGSATNEWIQVLYSLPVPSFWENPSVQTNLVPPAPSLIEGDVFMSPRQFPEWVDSVGIDGVLDCNYAPMVIIDDTDATITVFNNVPTKGRHTIELVNMKGDDVNIDSDAFTGGAVADRLLQKGCRMDITVINGLVYPDNP